MKKHDYMPKTQLGYLAWQDTFIPAASGIAGVIGLTPADLTALTGRNTDLHGKYATMQAGQNPHDPLTLLNSHLGFGAMAGVNPFAELGLNTNDPNMASHITALRISSRLQIPH